MYSMSATVNGSDNSLVINNWKLEDTTHLREAMFGLNNSMDRQMVTESKATICGTNNESQEDINQRMQRLIDEMKTLADEENTKKKHIIHIKKKISELNEELRHFENQFTLRTKLYKTLAEIEIQIEVMANKRKDLLSEMQSCVLTPKHLKTTNGESIVTLGSNNSLNIGMETIENRVEDKCKVDKSATNTLKKKFTSESDKQKKKKIRFNNELEVCTPIEDKKQLLIKKYNLVETKRIKRKPLSTQPMLTSAPNNLTFGVRASRPARMGCSQRHLQNIIEDTEQTLEETQTSIDSGITDNSLESNESFNSDQSLTATNSQSTNKYDSQLKISNSSPEKTESKYELKIKLKPSLSPNSLLNTCRKPKRTKGIKTEKTLKSKREVKSFKSDIELNKVFEDITQTKTNVITNTSVKPITNSFHTQQTISERIESKVELISDKSNEQSLQTIQNKVNELNVEKVIKVKTENKENLIEIVDILSDNEEKECKAKEESLSIKRKDIPKKIKIEAEVVNREESQKYIGFEALEFKPTIKCCIRPFTPLPVPNTNTSVAIIDMKSFKNYLIISFLDSSVRRYHIEDRNDIMVFEGHRGLVMAMIVVESLKRVDTFILYTGGKDHTLRAFNVITGQLLNCLRLTEEILCLDYNWSHIFAALKNGVIYKIPPIDEMEAEMDINDCDMKIKTFKVNENKGIWAIIAVKPMYKSLDNRVEPLITVSQNRLQLLNTSDSVGAAYMDPILHSVVVNCFAPIYVHTFRQYLFLSFKQSSLKTKENDKSGDNSMLSVYELKISSTWKTIKTIPITGLITDLKLNREDLIVSTNNGNIVCIDCTKLSIKWLTYAKHSDVKTCVKIEDRLVYGTIGGHIDVIYLDQHMMCCELCDTTFARDLDYKEHIKYEHPVFRSLNSPESLSNRQQS